MMFDPWSMEERALESMDPLKGRDLEIARFLADEAQQNGPGLRRRLASAFVGLGLRLDPEVGRIAERRPVLEVAHVRD
jgi:hypothetical protein